jgi:hypothetical protein
MGHQRLGILPTTRRWRQVIALITGGAGAEAVAAATADAAEASLKAASDDTALRHAFWLLTQIPLAARTPNFGIALRNLGLEIGDRPSLVEIASAMMSAIDKVSVDSGRMTDLSEMATKAATESLIAVADRESVTLFGETYAADEARSALHGLATERQFGVLARDFMSRLTRHCLDYFLSRELPNHVGINQRFQSLKDHDAFEKALALHCRETARIMEKFASGWYSKANFEGGITRDKAGAFVHVAFKKIRAELQMRRDVHA